MNQRTSRGKRPLRVGKLKSVQDVAKYQARLIRRASRGEGDAKQVNDLYKLCVMASMLVKTLEVSSLEVRILNLERQRT